MNNLEVNMAVSNRLTPSEILRLGSATSPDDLAATAEDYLNTTAGLEKKTWLEKQRQLTSQQIARLAGAISTKKMAAIAYGYMGIMDETIENIRFESQYDAEKFNREIILLWTKKTSSQGPDQVDVSN